MNKLFLSTCLFVILCGCGTKNTESTTENTAEEQSAGKGKLEFEESAFDFGEIKEGETVSHTFRFKNVGTDPVEIFAVNVSCGCTVASKPEKPVGVGQTAEITINFNSSGKAGTNRKTVSVVSNAENNVIPLNFTAVVLGAADTNKE